MDSQASGVCSLRCRRPDSRVYFTKSPPQNVLDFIRLLCVENSGPEYGAFFFGQIEDFELIEELLGCKERGKTSHRDLSSIFKAVVYSNANHCPTLHNAVG